LRTLDTMSDAGTRRPSALPPLILSVVASMSIVPAHAGTLDAGRWKHGWNTTAAMTFADFNSDQILSDAQAHFVAAK
jgi:hypothetical protein